MSRPRYRAARVRRNDGRPAGTVRMFYGPFAGRRARRYTARLNRKGWQ